MSGPPDSRGNRAAAILERKRPLVIAHRGYSSQAPENTLPSFELALAVEPDLVELDYYHCREGLPVVFHDRTLDRTTDARDLWHEDGLTVGSRNLRELQHLDAGAWFHPRFAGTRLSSLSEALDCIQPRGVTLIERKSGDPETLARLLRDRNEIDDVVVQSFDWHFIEELHKLEGDLVLGALGPPGSRHGHRLSPDERKLNTPFIEEIAKTGASIIGWSTDITEDGVGEAHERGLKVFVYVVNTLECAGNMLDLGVDGLISDNPGLMWKAVADRHTRPVPDSPTP